jgi:hypothetical protein
MRSIRLIPITVTPFRFLEHFIKTQLHNSVFHNSDSLYYGRGIIFHALKEIIVQAHEINSLILKHS